MRSASLYFSISADNFCFISSSEIFSGENISIGNNCKINPDVFLNGRSGITIGDNVTLSHGAKLISTGYDVEHWMETGERVHIDNKPIYIGDNCWIGTNAVIVGNVKIGSDVLIAPLTYVNFDVPDHSIVIGNPGRIIPRENATKEYVCNRI